MSSTDSFQYVWIVSITLPIAASLIIFSLPTFLKNASGLPSPSSLIMSTMRDNDTRGCAMLANQNIVFANIHIIQAIRDTADNNKTGALDQLSLAQEQLEKALVQQQC
jgi:hypothetical protein